MLRLFWLYNAFMDNWHKNKSFNRNYMGELIYKTETKSQISKSNFGLCKRNTGGGILPSIYSSIFFLLVCFSQWLQIQDHTDYKWNPSPPAPHTEVHSLLGNNLLRKFVELIRAMCYSKVPTSIYSCLHSFHHWFNK